MEGVSEASQEGDSTQLGYRHREELVWLDGCRGMVVDVKAVCL